MLLDFTKPAKARPTEVHNKLYQADSAPPGVYVPNMSENDMKKWKAKHVTGKDERVEIRRTFEGIQVVIIVYQHPVAYDYETHTQGHEMIKISSNGPIHMDLQEWEDMKRAISEARLMLSSKE